MRPTDNQYIFKNSTRHKKTMLELTFGGSVSTTSYDGEGAHHLKATNTWKRLNIALKKKALTVERGALCSFSLTFTILKKSYMTGLLIKF